MTRIHVYTVVYNEEFLLPYFLRHYGAFAQKIVCFDNMSTDRSAEIIARHPTAVRIPFDTGGKYLERALLRQRHRYKESKGAADWVMVVDADEFLYHPQLPALLASYQRAGITFPKVEGFDMVAEESPSTDGQIYDVIKTGTPNPWYCKRAVFNPELDVTYSAGCHKAAARGNVVESEHAEIKLLHYAFAGRAFYMRRQRERGDRQSADNLRRGWGLRYQRPDSYFAETFDRIKSFAGPVI